MSSLLFTLNILIFQLLLFHTQNAQENQKTGVDSYGGRWSGRIVTRSIETNFSATVGLFGGRPGSRTEHEQHATEALIELEVTATDPVASQRRNLGLASADLRDFIFEGNAVVSGKSDYSHSVTKECEECRDNPPHKTNWYSKVKITVVLRFSLTNELEISYLQGLPKSYRDAGVGTLYPNPSVTSAGSGGIAFKAVESEEGSHRKEVNGILSRIHFRRIVFTTAIQPQEVIRTDPQTRIEVTLPDQGRVTISENTAVSFRSESLVEVLSGKIRAVIQKLNPKAKFDVHTPVSATSVRGTEFHVEVGEDGTTNVVVFDGEVEFSDREGRNTVQVKKGQESVVRPGERPAQPVTTHPDQILKWWD